MTIQELYDWAKAKDIRLLDRDIQVRGYYGDFRYCDQISKLMTMR